MQPSSSISKGKPPSSISKGSLQAVSQKASRCFLDNKKFAKQKARVFLRLGLFNCRFCLRNR
jgi:hypothetical protein